MIAKILRSLKKICIIFLLTVGTAIVWLPIIGMIAVVVVSNQLGESWHNAYDGVRNPIWTEIAYGEPPMHLIGPRIHPIGTLARLQYETFDSQGQRMDCWQVRALVPPVPGIAKDRGTHFPEAEYFPQKCHAAAERSHGVLLRQNGEPGIAPEWILRMPVGRAFELSSRPLITQDLLDKKQRHFPQTSRRVGGSWVMEPSRIQVTLVEAQTVDVRLGKITEIECAPGATIPIPVGLSTTQWVQLNGCAAPLKPLGTLPDEPRRLQEKKETEENGKEIKGPERFIDG